MAATAGGAVNVLAVGDARYFKEKTAVFVWVEDVLQTLSLIFEEVPKFYLIHCIVFKTAFWDGAVTMPTVIANIERCRFERTPATSLTNKVVEVCKSGIGLYLEFDGEVFHFRTNSGNGIEHKLMDEAALFGILYKIENVLDLRGCRELLTDSLYRFGLSHAALEDDAVSLMYRVDDFAIEATATKTYNIQSIVRCWMASADGVRENALGNARAAANHRVTTDAAELMH